MIPPKAYRFKTDYVQLQMKKLKPAMLDHVCKQLHKLFPVEKICDRKREALCPKLTLGEN